MDKHERALMALRLERNRITDPQCWCAWEEKEGSYQRKPNPHCPIQHAELAISPFIFIVLNRRWPYQNEPREMKYPDGETNTAQTT
jgi:hypothetical protein